MPHSLLSICHEILTVNLEVWRCYHSISEERKLRLIEVNISSKVTQLANWQHWDISHWSSLLLRLGESR